MKKTLYVLFTLCLGFFGIQHLSAQSVFNGFVIEEVPIDPAIAATIQTEAGFTSLPRCWRIYACLNADMWELQALAGVNESGTPHPLIIECPSCTGTNQFYQSIFGGFLGSSLNPSFFSIIPQSEFDSYFYIGDPTYSSSDVIWVPDPTNNPAVLFESGGPLIDDAIGIGSAVSGFWSPPSDQGTADAQYRVFLAQLTTDGVFSGIGTLQFRRLNPDNTVFLPLELELVYDATFSNEPGQFDTQCPQVFLPAELVSFAAAASDDRVNLLWRTASEERTETFTVERSMNLEGWIEVGTLPAAGYSTTEHEYFLTDDDPMPGVNYYRLKEIDSDGSVHFSDVRSALFRPQDFTVYPNPASDRVWFKGDLSLVQSIRILNMQGQRVLEQQGLMNPIREMEVRDLATGTYLIEFSYANNTSRRTLLQVVH